MHLIINFWFLFLVSLGFIPEFTSTYYTIIDQQQEKPLIESIKRGEIIYSKFCARCHKTNGQGSKNYPPLANSDWLTTKPTKSIHAIKYGLKGNIIVNGKSYKKTMPKQKLEDHEIADVLNYVMNNWSNTQNVMITTNNVKAVKN